MRYIPTVESFCTEVLAAGGTFTLETEEGWTHQNTCEESYTDERLDWLFAQSRNGNTDILDIQTIKRELADKLYNLSGQQVENVLRGLYIKNSKKFVIVK